eukprot:364201-Chlamydomonas_euryale.AAC.24
MHLPTTTHPIAPSCCHASAGFHPAPCIKPRSCTHVPTPTHPYSVPHQVDLDLGNYERFIDITLTKDSNITTGKIYQHVIERERRGDYLGKTVQVGCQQQQQQQQQMGPGDAPGLISSSLPPSQHVTESKQRDCSRGLSAAVAGL